MKRYETPAATSLRPKSSATVPARCRALAFVAAMSIGCSIDSSGQGTGQGTGGANGGGGSGGAGVAGDAAIGSGTISGTVKDAGGSPVAGAEVTTIPATASATTGSDGRFVLSNVPSGTYTLVATASGCRSAQKDGVVVASTQTITVDLTLSAPLANAVKATLLVKDNFDLMKVLPETAVIAETGAAVVTGADGTAELDCLTPGGHVLHASRNGYVDTWEPVEVQAGSGNDFHILMTVVDPPADTQGLPPRAIPQSFCVNTHTHYLLTEEAINIAASGFKFHRLGMDQYLIENAPWNGYENGVYNFGYQSDDGGGDGPVATVPYYLSQGLRMLGNVEPNSVKFQGPPRDDAQRADWANFVTQAAQTFKGKQILYAFSNEPELYFAGWQGESDVAYYVQAAKLASDAIHKVDPNAVTCAPGGAFGADFIAEGLLDAVDVYDEHTYRGLPEDAKGIYEGIHARMDAYGKHAPIINSEFGWDPSLGLELVAQYMVRAYLIDLLWDIRLTCYYHWNDLWGGPAYGDVPGNPVALKAFGVLVKELAGYRFIRRIELGTNQPDFCLAFEKDEQRRYAIWTKGDYKQVTFYVGTAKARTVNWDGSAETTIDTDQGRVALGIGGDPQYVEPIYAP